MSPLAVGSADVVAHVQRHETVSGNDIACHSISRTALCGEPRVGGVGEDLAEGAVERFLADLSEPLQARGVVLDVETISGPSTGRYVISINGNRIELYGEGSWDSIHEAEHPWYASTVGPLAFVNRLLATSGAVERLFTLYTGGNEGIVLLIDPAIVSCLLNAGLRDSAEMPVEAS